MLSQLLNTASAHYAENLALSFSNKQYTYRELNTLSQRLASSFMRLGIYTGDNIAFCLTNRPEAILCFTACFQVGAAAVAINAFFNAENLACVIRETAPKILITETSLLPEIAKLSKDVLKRMMCFLVDAPNEKVDLFESFDRLMDHDELARFFPDIPDNTIACIAYTSGSTGTPKGVMHTHHQLYTFLATHAAQLDYKSTDRLLVSVPIAFGYCFSNQILPSLYSGAAIFLISPKNPALIIDLIQNENITVVYFGSITLIRLLNHLKDHKTPTHQLRAIISAGDALPAAHHRRAAAIFGMPVHEGIGMSETWLYAMNIPGGPAKTGSMGRPCPGMQIKIVNPESDCVQAGHIGEIAVSGYSVFQGYLMEKKEEVDLNAGWFRTGDIGFIDNDGYLHFCARKTFAFQKNGSMIYPFQIEFALYEHEAVNEVAVVGTDDVLIVAYVVPNPGWRGVTSDDLIKHLQRHLSNDMLPDDIVFLTQLPKGVTGKVDRKSLMMQAINGAQELIRRPL